MTSTRRLFAACLTALCVAGAPGAQAVVTLSLDPAVATVAEGDIFSVAVNISGLGDGVSPSLGAFDLTLGTDPSLLVATGTPVFGDPVLGDQLDLFSLGSFTDFDFTVPGAATVSELSFDFPSDLADLQAPAFTLVTLEFRALAPGGPTPIGFGFVELTDEAFPPNPIPDVLLRGAEITITARGVPEPPALLLLALGVAGLVRWRRFRWVGRIAP